MSGQAAKPRTFLGLYHAGRWMGIAVRGGKGGRPQKHTYRTITAWGLPMLSSPEVITDTIK